MSHQATNEVPKMPIEPPRTIKPTTNIQKSNSTNLVGKRGRRRSSNSTLPCSICGELYSRRDNLKVHQRVHSGEKPFQCEECGAKFRWVGVLRTHQATHRRKPTPNTTNALTDPTSATSDKYEKIKSSLPAGRAASVDGRSHQFLQHAPTVPKLHRVHGHGHAYGHGSSSAEHRPEHKNSQPFPSHQKQKRDSEHHNRGGRKEVPITINMLLSNDNEHDTYTTKPFNSQSRK